MVNMKKILLFVIAVFLVLPMTCNASSDITNLSASYSNKNVIVTGSTSDSILAVAVMLYDGTGTNVLRMVTDSVSNDTFDTTIDSINLEAGTYIVKVANYEGGDYYETSFKVSTQSIDNPQTNDNILKSIVISVVSILGIIGCIVFLKKRIINIKG